MKDIRHGTRGRGLRLAALLAWTAGNLPGQVVAPKAPPVPVPAPGPSITVDPNLLRITKARAKAAARLRQLGGVPLPGVKDGWFFRDLAGHREAGDYLEQGLIGERRAAVFGTNTAFELQVIPAKAGECKLNLTPGATMVIHEGRRGHGEMKGESRGTLTFTVRPKRAPNGKADPKCPLLKPGEYQRAIFRQDALTEVLRGETGGLFAIGASNLGDPISFKLGPCRDDLLLAYDHCQREQRWGQKFSLPLPMTVSALYHAHNPVTSRTQGSWKVENKAQLIKHEVLVWLPCTVQSMRKPRQAKPPETQPRPVIPRTVPKPGC